MTSTAPSVAPAAAAAPAAGGRPPVPPALPEGLVAAAVVDLDAVAANVAVLRERAGGAALMAVVKADGYGHGMVPVARAALAGGASRLGVAHLREALELRAAGIDAPVLAWLTVPGDRYAEAVAAGVEVGVSAQRHAGRARRRGRRQPDGPRAGAAQGRHRALPQRLPAPAVGRPRPGDGPARRHGSVELTGVFSHFACADEPDHPSVPAQRAAFEAAVAAVERAGLAVPLRHMANSAATVLDERARFDAVRPGIALYGLSPAPGVVGAAELGLRPAMTLLARVAMVKDVPAGTGVSYGHTYTTWTATRLALLPVGYGDGVPRQASGTRTGARGRPPWSPWPGACAWTRWWSISGRGRRSPSVTWPCSSGTPRPGRPPRPTGPGPPGRSTTRS